MRRLSLLTLVALLLCSAILGAQTAGRGQATPAVPAVPANAVKLKGKVVDQSGGAMVGADVQVVIDGKPVRVIATGKTDSEGTFELNVAPGPYKLLVKVADFKDIDQTVRVIADMAPLNLTMTLGLTTTVDVTSVSNELGVDPDSALSTDVITGDALLDLPENEDDLLAYLTQLAQLKGGDGTVTLSVDGFTDANLPPLATIAEIRIVNSSFSADGSTGPRIEIVTKAGSGKWTATTSATFNDESLNAANHLAVGKRPKSQARTYGVTTQGPVIPGRLSINANVQNNETDSGGSDLRAVTQNGLVSNGVTSINAGRNLTLSPRLMINKVHNLTTSFNYRTTGTKNSGIGGLTLPERAANNHSKNWQLQLSDRITKGKLVDTLRFSENHSTSFNQPTTLNGYTINVTGAFNGGAAPNHTDSLTENFILGNTLQWQPKPKLTFSAIAFQLDYHRTKSNNQNDYNGTYTFASLYDYCATLAADFSVGSQCLIERQKKLDAQAVNPLLDITPNAPTKFTQTSGDAVIKVSQAELAMWAQGDWRASPRADVSFGLRYQVQQHWKDYNNLAPVVGLSYQLRTKGNWKTVVRSGVKMTQSTFSMGSYQQFKQSGATSSQHTITILSPSYPDPTLGGTVSLVPTTSNITTRLLAVDAVSPYNINPTFAWEQSMPRGMTLNATYSINRGYRQNRSININAPWPGTPLPADLVAALRSFDPTTKANAQNIVNSMRPFFAEGLVGNINETQSVGKSLTKTFNLTYRVNNYSFFNNKIRLSGNLTYSVTRGVDDSQFENQYDRFADWARTSATGSRLNSTITLNLPRRTTLALSSIGWQSGRPYSITLGTDNNGDSSNTDRPDAATCLAHGLVVNECVDRNAATGPSTLSLPQARISKIFILTAPKAASSSPSLGRLVSSFAEPAQGGGGGGGGGGFGGGGGGGGGTRAGGTAANPNRVPTGARTMTFTINATNIFNSSVRSNIGGVLSSSLFGQVTGGSGGRRLTLSMNMKLF